MNIRTDLAVEFAADKKSSQSGIEVEKYKKGNIKVSTVKITGQKAAQNVGRPIGKYVTLESDSGINLFELEELGEILQNELKSIIGVVDKTALVVGIGNTDITSDALGPMAASGVLATRHIGNELAQKIGLCGLKSVSVLTPGVLGQTGMETKEVIEGAVEKILPSVIILIDALAAREVSRLCNTIQISDSGISPGSGVGNSRSEISEKTVGIRCVTIGVPTVVYASTLCYDLTGHSTKDHEPLIVTPRDIDRLTNSASKVISTALNVVLQPNIDPLVLMSVV